ncbi:MAG: hypothetical protein WCK89_19840 [bacterium]
MRREACRKAGLQSPDPALQPACATLTRLQSLANQCFAFSRPHDSFGGQPKDAYATEQDAKRRASIIRKESSVSLRAYACQYGNGWHLTKA